MDIPREQLPAADMSIVSDLLAGGITGIGNVVDRGIEDIHGSTLARDAQASAEQQSVENEFASEFAYRSSRTWWDSFIDGLNRLPRPIMTFGTIGLFAWAMINPVTFTFRMAALTVVPQPLWYIFFTIVTFWFGGKIINSTSLAKMKWPSAQDIVKAGQAIQQMRQAPMTKDQLDDLAQDDANAPTDAALPTAKPMDPKAYAAQMADTSRPLTNAAIIEWNRRQQSKGT